MTDLTSETTEPWSSCCEHSGSEPSELERENMSGVSSTKRPGVPGEPGEPGEPGADTSGDRANVTALEPDKLELH